MKIEKESYVVQLKVQCECLQA